MCFRGKGARNRAKAHARERNKPFAKQER